MPRDQAIAAAYSEQERGHKVAKNVTVATGLSHYDQQAVPVKKAYTPSEVSDMVRKAVKR